MNSYRLGSRGEEVKRIQSALAEKGFYLGPVDGDFGGGTESAVKAFQSASGLDVDGDVGPITWNALFAESIPEPEVASEELPRRCLTLTATFETSRGPPECFSGVSGDFDGQGVSFGVLQWNFGQGSLQSLLKAMLAEHPSVMVAVFQSRLAVLQAALAASDDELMHFARSIQDLNRHVLNEPWGGMFKSLGRTPECQSIQVKHARGVFDRALKLAKAYGLWSERAVALMFDIVTQNGSIRDITRAQIVADFEAIPAELSRDEQEVERMEVVAHRRAEAANSRWVEDVRSRKLCIARGSGMVHGIRYDVGTQFGIGLTPAWRERATAKAPAKKARSAKR
jgi:hypothetical protein